MEAGGCGDRQTGPALAARVFGSEISSFQVGFPLRLVYLLLTEPVRYDVLNSWDVFCPQGEELALRPE